MFNPQQALAICTASLRKRKERGAIAYVLYYGNSANEKYQTISGVTVKALVEEFKKVQHQFQYAFIVKRGDETKILRFYNRSERKPWSKMTGTRKSKVSI